MLLVAVDERGACDRRLPPRDAAHANRADAPDQANIGVLERATGHLAEIAVDDLGVLVDEYQRIEVLARRKLLQQNVVGGEDRPH